LRSGFSIAESTPADFDWNKIFDDAVWFHFTGINFMFSLPQLHILSTTGLAALLGYDPYPGEELKNLSIPQWSFMSQMPVCSKSFGRFTAQIQRSTV
jgi:hypothetical protein